MALRRISRASAAGGKVKRERPLCGVAVRSMVTPVEPYFARSQAKRSLRVLKVQWSRERRRQITDGGQQRKVATRWTASAAWVGQGKGCDVFVGVAIAGRHRTDRIGPHCRRPNGAAAAGNVDPPAPLGTGIATAGASSVPTKTLT